MDRRLVQTSRPDWQRERLDAGAIRGDLPAALLSTDKACNLWTQVSHANRSRRANAPLNSTLFQPCPGASKREQRYAKQEPLRPRWAGLGGHDGW